MSEFQKTKSRSKLAGISDVDATDPESVRALSEKVTKAEEEIKGQELVRRIISELELKSFTNIRCLALGSPCRETNALYQLALLNIVVKRLSVKSVSMFDPVSTPLDIAYFDESGYSHEEADPSSPSSTLYYLPHADLHLTEQLLFEKHPVIMLSNNTITHTDRLLTATLHNQYPTLSLLRHILSKTTNQPCDDGFQAPKKKRRNKPTKFKPLQIDYTAVPTKITEAQMVSFKEFEEGPWLNAFTDISCHTITYE
ncbi:SRR1-like protein BER1 [Cyberlindnera fabianii]|uniref:SRR1-like protein BER1 n=1 Tax=Cyberlindnera fabianii TaxID=36022 RepID=A0A1V2L597_CYBFA|nr:SRR1-like protein BER1 [Cyberlindnera fabianii]